MRCHEAGGAGGGGGAEGCPDELRVHGVLMRRRLVDQQDPDSSRRARAIATRCCWPIEISGRVAAKELVDRQPLEKAGGRRSADEPRRQLDVLLDRQLWDKAEALRDVRELTPRRRFGLDRPVVGIDPAPRHHEERGLARARAAEDQRELALPPPREKRR